MDTINKNIPQLRDVFLFRYGKRTFDQLMKFLIILIIIIFFIARVFNRNDKP